MKEIKMSKKGLETFGPVYSKYKFYLERWHRNNPDLFWVRVINQYGKELKILQQYHRDFFIIE